MASFNQIKSTLPFEDDDAFLGHDHLFGSFNTSSYDTQNDAIFGSHSPSANGVNCGGLSPEENEKGFIEEADSEGPILPPPSEIIMEECFAVREWRRQNEIRIEENEKREKEILSQILSEADDYKVDFYNRRKVSCETNRKTNREKEKVFLAKQEKFYAAAADKNYWKAISELIPNEVPAIEKKKGKKDEEKKLSISVVQGPKPGKPTDLTRMRQLLLKLKHNTPDHLNPSTPTPPEDSKASTSTVASAPLEATA